MRSATFYFVIAIITVINGLFDVFAPPRTPMWMVVGLIFIGVGVYFTGVGVKLLKANRKS